MTALHYAAKANRTAVIRELARLGADLEAKNDAGQVPAQLTKDRLLRRLFQQYLGGGSWGGAPGALMDRFVPASASRVVDYVAVMTVRLAPQLREDCDELSDVRQATVAQLCRFPMEDHDDNPMTDASNLAEICTQTCGTESGPLAPYGTLLTDTSGARSYVWSKVLGVYQDAAQRGRARVHTALGPPPADVGDSLLAGEMTARVVLVLARRPYTAAFASICEHVGDLILEECMKWGSLPEWPLDMDNDRNRQIKFCMEHYASELPLPLPSTLVEHRVMDRAVRYGDAHASHSSFPHLEDADLRCLTSRLGPDTILVALSCLLQEQSVLLLTDHMEDLAPATSALLGLLFPLRWPHTLIPVLPSSLVHYLEAPVPFLMGMDRKGLERVGADLSCVTMVNLTTNTVVLPIRPITSVSTVAPVDANGREAQRRPSRRDSDLRSLSELPRALKTRAESRVRRCVPLEQSPISDRVNHQPRASRLYAPGIRVAVADVMVELFGAYQTYRYVAGSQKRMVSEAPQDHRKLLEAIYSTQLWRIFSDDLLSEEAGANGENWEEQAQLFCACVERAKHQGGVEGPSGGSHSCQDVLYPSEDVEEQLSQLSVYPEPVDDDGSIGGGGGADGESGEGGGPSEGQAADTQSRASAVGSATGTHPEGSATATVAGLQEKTDEVLKSITDSFATVTDIFGGGGGGATPAGASSAKNAWSSGGNAGGRNSGSGAAVASGEQEDSATSNPGRTGGGGGSGGEGARGWDLFKPPTMAEMKRRLEDMTAAGLPLSPAKTSQTKPAGSSAGAAPAAPAAGLSVRGKTGDGRSVSPARQDVGAAASAGLAKFGEGWRDFRRRSTEAVEEAVTKLKTALDDSDDEGAAEARVASRVAENGRVRAAAAKARTDAGVTAGGHAVGHQGRDDDDDAFWRPFGADSGGGGGGAGDEGEPVPLPTAEEVRRGRAAGVGKSASAARAELDAYYGGSGGGGGR
ncbi:unnamed protein product [Scytosiphon promiscuus]